MLADREALEHCWQRPRLAWAGRRRRWPTENRYHSSQSAAARIACTQRADLGGLRGARRARRGPRARASHRTPRGHSNNAISTCGVAKVNFFIYHTKWEAHVRMVR
jgi:hypothetical protein